MTKPIVEPNIREYRKNPLSFIQSLKIPSAHGTRVFRDCMAEYQLQWFRSIAPSLLSVAAGKQPPIGRFWCERTKGASKDSDIALCLLWLLAFSPRKLDVQCGASDRDQAGELKKACVDTLRLNSWLSERIDVLNWSLVCRATGSECSIIAADVAGSHGARPDILVLNELSHVQKQEYAENLMDNATKRPMGLLIIASNAGFLGSWQAEWREMAQSSERWSFHSYARPAPWLSEAEVEEAQRRNSKARFQRLYYGQWVSQSGDALDQSDIDACISEAGPTGRRAGWRYIAGLDLSVSHDHSALCVLGVAPNTQEISLAYCESWAPDPATKKVDLMKIESVILQMHRRYKFTLVYDPFQCALLAQRLQRQRIKTEEMTFTGKNLNLMASTLLEVFRSRRLRMYAHSGLVRDLGRLSIVEKAFGHKLESVSDQHGHADTAIALAIALPAAVEQSGRREIVAGALLRMQQGDYASPFAMPLSEFDRIREHEQMLAEAGSDPAGTEQWQQFMRFMGRRP